MNTDNGQIYHLPRELVEKMDAEPQPNFQITPRVMRQWADEHLEELQAADEDLAAQMLDLKADVERGARVVEVSAEVAHAQRLGQRELERRARRRKAAKQARKRNR